MRRNKQQYTQFIRQLMLSIEMAKNGSFYAVSRFYPDEHFPHGIARSGEFVVTHAELLERHGRAYSELHEGIREPVNEEERRFLQVCREEREALTDHEKAWKRYCHITRKVAAPSPFSGREAETMCEPSDEPAQIDELITG